MQMLTLPCPYLCHPMSFYSLQLNFHFSLSGNIIYLMTHHQYSIRDKIVVLDSQKEDEDEGVPQYNSTTCFWLLGVTVTVCTYVLTL